MKAARGLGIARIIVRATALAVVAFIVSVLVAYVGLGRSYYVGTLLAIWTALFVLVAWFGYLRRDGFFGAGRMAEPAHGAAAHGAEAAVPRSTADQAVYNYRVSFGDEVIERAREPDSGGRTTSSRGRSATLIVAAAELASLSIALYYLGGIGASFF